MKIVFILNQTKRFIHLFTSLYRKYMQQLSPTLILWHKSFLQKAYHNSSFHKLKNICLRQAFVDCLLPHSSGKKPIFQFIRWNHLQLLRCSSPAATFRFFSGPNCEHYFCDESHSTPSKCSSSLERPIIYSVRFILQASFGKQFKLLTPNFWFQCINDKIFDFFSRFIYWIVLFLFQPLFYLQNEEYAIPIYPVPICNQFSIQIHSFLKTIQIVKMPTFLALHRNHLKTT